MPRTGSSDDVVATTDDDVPGGWQDGQAPGGGSSTGQGVPDSGGSSSQSGDNESLIPSNEGIEGPVSPFVTYAYNPTGAFSPVAAGLSEPGEHWAEWEADYPTLESFLRGDAAAESYRSDEALAAAREEFVTTTDGGVPGGWQDGQAPGGGTSVGQGVDQEEGGASTGPGLGNEPAVPGSSDTGLAGLGVAALLGVVALVVAVVAGGD